MEGQQSAVTHEFTVRAAADTSLAAQIIALSPPSDMRQGRIMIDKFGYIVGAEPIHTPDPLPTRAEFDALLARLAAAEAQIEMLKKGRGPEPEGVF